MKVIREIKSFVCRNGRMTSAQRKSLQTLWPQFGLKLSEKSLDFSQIFNNNAELHLEIGFGMGQGLLAMAQQNPQHNYLGVDIHQPGLGALLTNIAKQQVDNIRVFNTNALDVLRQCIADHSLAAVYLFFPDPWPKRRHHKRRLVQDDFIELIYCKLQPQGVFHVATDWEDYATHVLSVMKISDKFINQAGDGNFSGRPDYRPITKFEQRGQRLGHTIRDMIFIAQES
ncbi:MAG: tRNA (guanosine(46)-N7)-methyltransferase TrmB [Gammaproteobacteria bacterium]|nr:tRNA (guanosine(46)-N7)-methyltransferase TrmB [Gammaproteobacteria bacterium]